VPSRGCGGERRIGAQIRVVVAADSRPWRVRRAKVAPLARREVQRTLRGQRPERLAQRGSGDPDPRTQALLLVLEDHFAHQGWCRTISDGPDMDRPLTRSDRVRSVPAFHRNDTYGRLGFLTQKGSDRAVRREHRTTHKSVRTLCYETDGRGSLFPQRAPENSRRCDIGATATSPVGSCQDFYIMLPD
jgi:hypothetical protein